MVKKSKIDFLKYEKRDTPSMYPKACIYAQVNSS